MAFTRPVKRARMSALALGVALAVVPFVSTAAGAATTSAATSTSPSLEGGAFGTYLNQFNLGSPYGSFNYGPNPAVVTPPAGGTATAFLGPVTFGGLPPYYTPFISVGPSGAATAGAIQNNLPEVDSAAAICSPGANLNMNNNSFAWPVTAGGGQCANGSKSTASVDIELGSGKGVLSVRANKLTSACYAQDSTSPTQVAASTYASSLTINGKSMPAGLLPPNTTYVESYPTSTGTGTLTLVFNEQVPGQSTDHYKGILVNALHVYVGSPGSTYANLDSAVFAESRCEVAIIPIPPGIIPEAPLALALPISAAVIGGGGLIALRSTRRRRRSAGGAAAAV